jgi:FAD/FMN-containing dehydrogenase
MSDWRFRAEVTANWMMDAGALGVALMGSYARHDEHPLSDVDIVGLGTGEPDFREEDGVILSVSWVEPDTAMASFDSPEDLIITVPGWRTAVPLNDPTDQVSRLIATARDWTWTTDLEDKARDWLARLRPLSLMAVG